MVAELKGFYDDLHFEGLRISRPSKFVFFCGGAIPKNPKEKEGPHNLRDYLTRVRPMRQSYEVVLAERAIQLYRDTEYRDLISFEEDIARIASVVLVIAESAGSLAELGAFVASPTISKVLRVVISEKNEGEESFVRFGPIQRVKNAKRDHLGVYPWRSRKSGNLIVKSARPHYSEIRKFIDGHVRGVPASAPFVQLEESKIFLCNLLGNSSLSRG